MKYAFIFLSLVASVCAEDKKSVIPPKINAERNVAIKESQYTDIRKSYVFDLATTEAKTVKVRNREQRPGITSLMTAECDNGLIIAIVSTKIRADYPQDDTLLTRQKPQVEAGAQIFGADYEISDREVDGRRLLDYTLLHESFDPTVFPFGSGQEKNPAGKETIGIHRMFVRSGHFFEVAIILTNSGDSTADLKKKSLAVMNRTVRGMRFTESRPDAK